MLVFKMELPVTLKSPARTSNRYLVSPGPTILVLRTLYSAGFKEVGAVVAVIVIANLRTLLAVATDSRFWPGAQIVAYPGAVASPTIYAAGASTAWHTASPGVPSIGDTDAVYAAIRAEFGRIIGEIIFIKSEYEN